MKNLTLQLRLASLLSLILLACTAAYGQLTPTGDSYTNTALPTTNYGAKTVLDVESSQTTFIQFNLSSIPSAYTSADITKATLKLYVNAVTTAGSFNVDYVNGTWTESKIDASNAPALGTTIAASVPLVTADKNQYILIDITAAVQAWLSGTANDGIALVGNSPVNANFDSKESTTTSHSPELDIVYAGIAGVSTASGSGLIGGGTSGTLNLALTNTCATNQVLHWNGTSWACAAVGTGTVTSVASGAGLTGGPITGSGTLSIAANACASGNALSALPFTCSPFATLGANTFTGNQTVNGNLSATGVVTGSSYQIGSNLFDYGSFANSNAFLGFAGNATMTGQYNTASGVQALSSNTTGYFNTANGYQALYNNCIASAGCTVGGGGQANSAFGLQALFGNTTGSSNAAFGMSAMQTNTTGNSNTAMGYASGQTLDDSALTGANNTALGSAALFSTGTLNYATAIGAFAEVAESNAIVLGSFAGSALCLQVGCPNTNVGIGTAAPGFLLEVYAAGASNAQIEMASTGTDAAISVNNKASGGREYWIDSGSGGAGIGTGNFAVYDRTAGATRLVVNSAGRVGIGTTSPDDLLSVNGSADKPGGGSWGTYSDGRLKNLNGSYKSGLSQVLKLNPVRYRYKPDNALGIRDTDEHIGVVAQDVQRVIPEAVTENSKGYLLVNNDPIIWSMLNAIKEQQREFEQQQAVLRTQAAAIRNLKSELRSTRQTLQKVKAQVAASQLTVVAKK